jgi:signal transduction histidine kinase
MRDTILHTLGTMHGYTAKVVLRLMAPVIAPREVLVKSEETKKMKTRILLRYTLGACCVVATTGCGLLLFELGESRPFPLFFLPILFSAWFLGRGPALLATGLSSTAIQYFFIPPVWSFSIQHPTDLGSQIIFITEGIIVTFFAAAKKHCEEELEHRVAERTIQLKAANQGLEMEIAERKEVEIALEQEHRIVQLLRIVAEAANSATTIDQALQSALNHVCAHLGWPLGCAYRVQAATKFELSSTGVWYIKDATRFEEFRKLMDASVIRGGQKWIGRAVQTKQAIWLEDVGYDVNLSRTEAAKTSGIETSLIVPVFMSQAVVAVLEFFSTETNKPDDRLIDAIQQVGIQLGRVFERDEAQKRMRAHERLATIGRTAAVLAHEIGNALNGMAMAVHLLRQEFPNDKEPSGDVPFSLQALSSEINRLTSLVENYRSVGRPHEIELEPTDLSELVQEVLALEGSSYARRGTEIALDWPSDLPRIMADSGKIKQLLLNLCRNAVEAMPEGGRLTVKAFVAQGCLHLHIIDTGVGIPEGVNIFEPFVSTKSSGTGLGLMIAKQIVLAHQGTISHASARGKGTVFQLTFPLCIPESKTVGSLYTLPHAL